MRVLACRRAARLASVLRLMLAAGELVACGAASASGQARKWIEEDGAQKRRLEDAGFPQYIGE